MSVIGTLLRVRELIGSPGTWRQEESDHTASYTLFSAVARAAKNERQASKALAALGDDLSVRGSLRFWHDSPDRTQAEVLALVNRCIVTEEVNAE